jgi:hypothetical protein
MARTTIYSLLLLLAVQAATAQEGHAEDNRVRNVAAIVTEYRHNSHADIIISRLLQTDTLDGKGNDSPLKLVSLYTDQKPKNDIGRMLSASHRFPIFDTIAGALTLGSDQLAVEGVLVIGEHGSYPKSANGNTKYPKRRFLQEVFQVFKQSGRVVPVFCDKHLADNWQDAQWIHDTARAMKVPLMAGSSIPTTWRTPPADIAPGSRIQGIVALTYGPTDAYGFHALEMVQALAEQRQGGETGITAVQCLADDAVWEAATQNHYDPALFRAAWERLSMKANDQQTLRESVEHPVLFSLTYADGLQAHILELNGAVGQWTAAWRYAETGEIESTQFQVQDARPGMHFTYLLHGIERMMLTCIPAWPVQRTLMTSGALDALLTSKLKGGVRLATPYLEFSYRTDWRWHQPPPPPPGRPWEEQ